MGFSGILFIIEYSCICEVDAVEKKSKFLIIESDALPEVFSRVLDAKNYLESGRASSISQAAKMAGISRSALYKYRDAVFSYENNASGKVVNYYVLLKDKPGMLSGLISEITRGGGNILTINQNIPVDGVAAISISLSLDATNTSDMEMLSSVKKLEGVVEARSMMSR